MCDLKKYFLQHNDYRLIVFRYAPSYRTCEWTNDMIGVILPQSNFEKEQNIIMISHPINTARNEITCGEMCIYIDKDSIDLIYEPTEDDLNNWKQKTKLWMEEVMSEKGYDSCYIDVDKVWVAKHYS
jgi:hypothetical protein